MKCECGNEFQGKFCTKCGKAQEEVLQNQKTGQNIKQSLSDWLNNEDNDVAEGYAEIDKMSFSERLGRIPIMVIFGGIVYLVFRVGFIVPKASNYIVLAEIAELLLFFVPQRLHMSVTGLTGIFLGMSMYYVMFKNSYFDKAIVVVCIGMAAIMVIGGLIIRDEEFRKTLLNFGNLVIYGLFGLFLLAYGGDYALQNVIDWITA